MAFQNYLGNESKSVFSETNLDFMFSFLPKKVEPITNFESIQLIDVINLTDFVEISRMMSFNEQDQVMSSLEKIKTEKSIV